MLSQRGKPLLVHDGYTFGIQYIRKDKKYWQCNLSRKFNCKARVTTTELGDIIVTNNEHCHTEIRQHLRKDYKLNRLQTMSQSLLQQHALQMNLNRLSAVAAQRQQRQQQPQPDLHPANLTMGNINNNGSSSLERENNEMDKNNNNNNNGGGNHHQDETNEKNPPTSEAEQQQQQLEQEQKRVSDWKDELFRSVAMRPEDIK